MRTHVFLQKGTWLKCALHAHTTNSDGELAPTDLVRHYEEAGFDVLVITDHWVRTVEPSTVRLLVVPGTELDALRRDAKTYAHVLALGVESDPEPPAADFPGLEETVDWVRANGGVPFIAHTYWSGLRTDEFEEIEGLAGIEVFNAGCELEVGRGHAGLHWDEALQGGRDLLAIATDDSHHPGKDSAHAWVWARCEERSREGLLAALDSGSFYSSSGPEIAALETEDDDLVVRCSPARSITLLTGRTKGARVNAGEGAYIYSGEVLGTDGNGLITEARLTRPRGAPQWTARDRGRSRPASLDESTMALEWRGEALEELAGRELDLLVVGAGIIGAGIANEAAHAGLAVALVDKGDFGAATSSSSSKLVHGGLRYLRLGDVRLVREAHKERRALMRIVAPHLVRRLPFLFPVYERGPYRAFTIQTGLWLYSTLARERLGGLVPPERSRRSIPPLRLEGLRGCGLYADAWTHDSRLCLANVRAAADAGATVLNYAEVTELRREGGRVAGAEVRDLLGGETASVRARVVVNATGPWVDRLRGLEDPAAAASIRLSRGAHAILRLEQPWSAALTIPHDTVRVSFAVPWEGMLLLGTTDTLYEGEPDDAAATPEDIDQILAEAAVALEPEVLRPDAIRSVYAGLRVLPGAEGATASARRETVYQRGPGGMLTVAGGKLTTYRQIALGALRQVRGDLGLHSLPGHPVPLPGAEGLAEAGVRLARAHPDLEPAVRSHLAHLYGTLAADVLEEAADDPSLLDRLNPEGPDIAAQAVYAKRHEWACKPEDILRRRTTLELRGLRPTRKLAEVLR